MNIKIAKLSFCIVLSLLTVFINNAFSQRSSLSPEQLRCEYLENPNGLDELHPRLSWTLKTNDNSKFGSAQTAYQILVSGSVNSLKTNKGEIWNSDWIKSSNMQLISYAGKTLLSDKTYYWKIRIKDDKGNVSAWSENAQWSTGLFNQSEWQAKWIGTDQIFNPAIADCNIWDPWLRKNFNVEKKPERAMLFLASVGFHELYVNGKKVTDDVLSPSVTDHAKRARYVAYDIAPLLKNGDNVIAIWLGTSWSIFGPYIEKSRPNTPIVIAQANIGGQLLKTDESWITHKSPNKLLGTWDFGKMGGELYDANNYVSDWNAIKTDESGWQKAIVYKPNLVLSAQQVESNKVFEEIKPINIVARPDGTFRVDMGINFAGWTSVNISGNPGDKVEFLYSERSQDDITFALHSAYIIDKTGKGTFRNRFNYSSGRWITIKGLKTQPALSDIQGWMLRTNYKESTSFECSDPLQNWIYKTVKWTFQNLSIGGFIVDCPQRERLGYGGDAHATCETGMMNYKMGAFYTKWMEDWRDVKGTESVVGDMYDTTWFHKGSMSGRPLHKGILPHSAPTYMGGGGPPWGGIVVSLPWFIYQQEGDVRMLNKNFELIQDWLAFLKTQSKDEMLVRFGGDWDFLGDWLWPGATAEGMNNNKPQTVFLNNCYMVYNFRTAAKIARVLGKNREALDWEKQASATSVAIHAKYYNGDDHSYSDRSMSNLAAALIGEVMPEPLKPLVMKRLEKEILEIRKGHINVGITGGAMLFKVLRDAGRDDLIYSMTSQTTYPSWGYMKENGATTIWEMWEKDLPGHSLLHSSYLYPGAWYIDGLAGIKKNLDQPGMQHFVLRPPMLKEEQMTWARASMDSPAGLIKTFWKREKGILRYEITIPPNTKATLQIPLTEAGAIEGGTSGLKEAGKKDGFRVYQLSSGNYKLQFKKG
ncbi:family 78 glycoside hydrolase catalytic domain [Pedobacter sp. JCM 36344]|uniref:family 78 glycoside hydrolase catalytic domain n=1 Tax=Pedobacter sp. JCM 36344 TaxID=3374280 RepID=UPI00397D9A08